MIIIALIYNLSVLVAISVLSGFIDIRYNRKELKGKIFQGLLFGLTAIIGMMYPFVLTKGIIFDGRSIVISLCTLFFGPVSGGIAAVIALIYRNILGGGGALMGSLVISESFIIGLFFYYRRKNVAGYLLSKLQMYYMGVIVHIIMLVFVLALPSKNIFETYRIIGLTVLGVYPIVTILIGKILLDQEQNQEYFIKLQQNEELFRTTLYSIGEGVIITNTEGRIKNMNALAENMIGLKFHEIFDLPLSEIIKLKKTESRFSFEGTIKSVVENGEIISFAKDIWLISKNENLIPISINLAPIRNEKETTRGMVVAFRDITERRKWEDELLIYSKVFQQSPASIMITSVEGKIEFVNPKFSEMTGFMPDEIIGKNPRILQVSDGVNDDFIKLEKVVVKGEEWRGEILNRKKDGSLFWVSSIVTPIKDVDGRITHFLSVKEDITGKKELELELKKALDKSEESDRLKSSLLANMSHEFRTPMTGILGIASILKEKYTDSKTANMLDWIMVSGKRLMNTLDAVLEIANLESNYEIRKTSLIKLSEEVDKISEDFERNAKMKGLQYVYVNKNTDLYVRSTQKNITNILSNLLDNGIKFTLKGGVQLIIDSEREGENLFAKIIVADTGIGIEEKYLDKIFEEFRQVSEGFSRSYEGAGLGLSVVKKIVGLSLGRITVKSKLNEGTVFTVFLPAELNELPELKEEIKPSVPSETAAEIKISRSPVVLLVEDNLINKEVTKTYIKHFCQVEHAFTGAEALEMVTAKDYDLILMDVNLGPGIDGIETSRKIRNMEKYKETPIIAITGYSMEKDKEQILSAGIDDILVKPFNRTSMVHLVSNILIKLGFHIQDE